MPIRFRCPGCDGLLSIATRKAGAEVACPKCREGLIVPTPVAPPATATGAFDLFGPTTAGGTMVKPKVREAGSFSFERPDFEKELEPVVRLSVTPTVVETTEPRDAPDPPPGYVPAADRVPVAESGMLVSRPTAIALGVGLVALVGMSFAVGVVVGR